MKIISFIIFIIASSFSINASAAISHVYRADMRPPEQVFRDGFASFGTNTNFVDHILGLSGVAGNRDSAFIPTSANRNSSMRFVSDGVNVHGTYYLYDIRPTDNFYYATTTIYAIFDRAGYRISEELRSVLSQELEYSAYGSISGSQIRGVTAYTRNSQGQLEGRYIANEYYIDSNTGPNDGNYVPSEIIGTIPNREPLNVTANGVRAAANQVPEDLANQYNFWTFGCFGFLSGLFGK